VAIAACVRKTMHKRLRIFPEMGSTEIGSYARLGDGDFDREAECLAGLGDAGVVGAEVAGAGRLTRTGSVLSRAGTSRWHYIAKDCQVPHPPLL
jgi:hypothetical protein